MRSDAHFPLPEELMAFSLGRSEGPRAEEIEGFLASGPDCASVFAAVPDDGLMRHLRGVRLPDLHSTGPFSDDTEVLAEEDAPKALVDHPRYHLLRKLGQGGMGAVYLCEHRLMRRLVAVKLIRAERVGDPHFVERFRREVQALAKLSHPHIVAAYDADEAGGRPLLVMEHVEGETLLARLARLGPFPAPQACDAARQIACALAFAHEKGMVHRDIKPHNLIRGADGVIKVLDFGLARIVRESSSSEADLTASQMVMGTADYIAPEQARDSRRADIRADIYSLGCTLYHLLTGRVPFPGGVALDKLIRHATEAPDFSFPAPVGLHRVFRKMLTKAPAERYQTPAEVIAALEPFTHTRPGKSQPSRGRRWMVAAILSLSAAAAIVIAAASPNDQRNERPVDPLAPAVTAAPQSLVPTADNLAIQYRIPVEAARNTFYGVDVSAGGKYALVSRDMGPGVQTDVYDARSGKKLFHCGGYMARFLGDGEEIVARLGNNFCVYQTASGKMVRVTREPYPDFWGMDVSPNGRYLASFSELGHIVVDLSEMKEMTRFWDGKQGKIHFTPDSKFLLRRPRGDDRWSAWDLENNRPTSRFKPLDGFTTLAFFFPDGSVAVTRDSDGARIDLDSGTSRGGFVGLDAPTGQNDGFYSATTRRIAQRYPDGRFLVYDTPFESNNERCRFQAPADDRELGPSFRDGRWSVFSNDDRFAAVLTNRSLYILALPPLPARD